MFRYRLHSPDGDDLGEATYAQMIHPDEEIIAGNNQHARNGTRATKRGRTPPLSRYRHPGRTTRTSD